VSLMNSQGRDHLLFPATLQTHASSVGGAVTSAALAVERRLKTAALLTRGVVVADSDLNNNELFHSMTASDSTFLRALEAGFVRRAARSANGTPNGRPASQAEVGLLLQKNSPARYAKIRPGHISTLDNVLTRVEGRPETPPLLWTLDQLATLFTYRLLKILDEEIDARPLADPAQAILARMSDWIRKQVQDEEPVTAAGLEEACRPGSAASEQTQAWDRIWPLVLASYNGNIPAALELALEDPSDHPTRFLPAGPDSSGGEMSAEMDLYGRPIADIKATYWLEEAPIVLPDPLRQIHFDEGRLDALSIEHLIELREDSAPEEFFALRHESLGSAELLEGRLPAFLDAAATYVDRLMTRANVLTRGAETTELTQALSGRGWMPDVLVAYYLRSSDPTEIVDQMMVCVCDCPVLSPQVAMYDLERLTQLQPELAQVLELAGGVSAVTISRPDYRVIKTFGEQLSTEPTVRSDGPEAGSS